MAVLHGYDNKVRAFIGFGLCLLVFIQRIQVVRMDLDFLNAGTKIKQMQIKRSVIVLMKYTYLQVLVLR